jgi:hypothetical protein
MVWFCNYCGKESLIGLMVDYKSTLVNSPKIICWLLISIIIWSNMLKQIIFVLLIALVFTEDICPQKLMMDCEKDAELGISYFIQPTSPAKRLPRRRVLTRLPISTV